MKAIGYIRCSTHEQADSGLGLEAQAERMRAQLVRQPAGDVAEGH